MPKKIYNMRLFNLDFNVKYSDNYTANEMSMGRVDIKSQEIVIVGKMKDDTVRTTILHECIHVMADKLGLELTEEQVCALETGFNDLIVGNPEFIKSFHEHGGTSEDR